MRLHQRAQLAPWVDLFPSRNNARLVFLLYRSKPVTIASVLCFITLSRTLI